MPIYVYKCEKCERVKEEIQKISDPPLTLCGHCGGNLQKQFTSATPHFKGSGWYETDYKKRRR